MSSQKISMVDLEHIAKLARINLTESEKTIFLPQLESVLEYLNILDRVDVSQIEPTFRVNKQSNIFHSDKINPSFSQKEALSTASKTQDGYFVVTGTIKK